eukprot:275319-Pelagomonas_calceolata.AAC.2
MKGMHQRKVTSAWQEGVTENPRAPGAFESHACFFSAHGAFNPYACFYFHLYRHMGLLQAGGCYPGKDGACCRNSEPKLLSGTKQAPLPIVGSSHHLNGKPSAVHCRVVTKLITLITWVTCNAQPKARSRSTASLLVKHSGGKKDVALIIIQQIMCAHFPACSETWQGSEEGEAHWLWRLRQTERAKIHQG